MTALVWVTVTVNGAAVPPALLEIEPVHVPAVGESAGNATANVTEAPGADAVDEPTAAIVATVPGRLFAPVVHAIVGLNVGARPLCATESVCVVGEPPITSATLFGVMLTAAAAGVTEGAAVGPGAGVAVAADRSRTNVAGTFAVSANGNPFDANVNVDAAIVAGPAQVRFHPATGSSNASVYVAPATIALGGSSSVKTGAAPNTIVAEDVTMIAATVPAFARPSGFRVSAELLIGRDGNDDAGAGCTVTTNVAALTPRGEAGAAIVPEIISCVAGNARTNVSPATFDVRVAYSGSIGVVWSVEGPQLTIACAAVISRKTRIVQPRRKK